MHFIRYVESGRCTAALLLAHVLGDLDLTVINEMYRGGDADESAHMKQTQGQRKNMEVMNSVSESEDVHSSLWFNWSCFITLLIRYSQDSLVVSVND